MVELKATFVLLFNRVIKERCINSDAHFIDNSAINCMHLNGSNLHLNRTGDRILGRNICAYLKLLRMRYVCCDNLCDKTDDNLCDKLIFKVFQSVLPPVERLVGSSKSKITKNPAYKKGLW